MKDYARNRAADMDGMIKQLSEQRDSINKQINDLRDNEAQLTLKIEQLRGAKMAFEEVANFEQPAPDCADNTPQVEAHDTAPVVEVVDALQKRNDRGRKN